MFGTVSAKMKTLKRYLLLLCMVSHSSKAQIIGAHTQFAPNIDRSTRLSPQQQGQILSDIQQHQHRFDLTQNRPNFEPQHFQNQNVQQQDQNLLSFLNQQQFGSPNSPQETFAHNQLLSTLPLLKSIPSSIVPTPQQTFQQISSPTLQSTSSQVVFPGQTPSQATQVVQHLTQTNFQPARQSSPFGPQFIQPRPTTDPLKIIEEQIKLLDPEKHKQKIQELREKQAIIEKHNKFVERQYEKALKKAQEDHEDFIKQQRDQKKQLYQRLYKSNNDITRLPQSQPRYLYPEEVNLFERAVKQYYIEHPTTTTTTTTTPKPRTTTEKINVSLNKSNFLPTALPQSKVKTIQSLEDLDQLQKEYKSQRIRKDDLLEQLRLAIGRSQEEDGGKNLASREISLSNGKKIQFITADAAAKLPKGKEEEITLADGKKVTVIRADDPSNKSDEEVTLPSGHQVKIFRTSDPNAIPKNLGNEPQEITLPNGEKAFITNQKKYENEPTPIEEIVLPNGEKVELIKTSDPNLVPDGVKVEPGSDLEKLVFSRTTTSTTIKPPKAILDELTKSVPSSNYEILKTGASGGLESIGKNLPNQKKVTFVLLEEQNDGTLKVQGVKGNGEKDKNVDIDAILNKIKRGEIKLPENLKIGSTTKKPEYSSSTARTIHSSTFRPIQATITPNSFATEEPERFLSTTDYASEEDSSLPSIQTNIGTQIVASSTIAPYFSSTTTTRSSKKTSRTPHILNSNSNDLLNQASSVQTSPNQNLLAPKPTEVTIQQSITPTANLFPIQETFTSSESSKQEMTEILKKNNLFAMAKFLKQSGLDTILNETGPYTVFVPTDKAFRTLLIQLGGPERAEEKFKENPRLLSGLLLHHVIPGAFKISSLQDEMTGVSLAGTQLRVNQYKMHDKEWNDVKVTTINGAKVLEESQDIDIPQGVAHAVDRVMFPLPVGDIVQTLQSDRERRFTSLLRAIFASGLDEMLQGSKIFTLIAPTEKAFAGLSAEDLTKLVTDKVLARELVLKHLMAGTLFTNGMRYYQIKDTLLPDRQITFSKQTGKVKVNNNLLSTQNIPATNGVIHAIDTLL